MGWACHTYLNVNPFIGASRHDSMITVPVPPFQIPGPLPHIELGVTQGLWFGSFPSTGHGKEIVADGLWLLGRTSDAGLGIPHISIPPSWMNVITSLFGMSMSVFGSSSVQLGCHNLLWGSDDCDTAATPFGLVPLSVNLGCFEPFCLPTDLVVVWGTVYVGMSWNDIWAALIDIAISMATDLISLGIGWGLGKLGKKIGEASSNKLVKMLTGTLADSTYEAYMKRAVATQGIGNALAMSDDDMARFVGKEAAKEGLEGIVEHLDEGAEAFMKQWGDQFTSNLDEAWEQGFKEALEELDALKAAGLADDVARKAAAQTVLEEAFEELAKSASWLGTKELLFELMIRLVKRSLPAALSSLLVGGDALGAGTEDGALSFGGAGWTELLAKKRGFAERYGEDDWLTLYEDVDSEEWGTGASEIDDDYWYAGTLFDATGTAEETSEEDDDYWYGEPATEAG